MQKYYKGGRETQNSHKVLDGSIFLSFFCFPMPHLMYKHFYVYTQESISLLSFNPVFTNIEHCTNTVVKVISQLLTLLPAVSETSCSFLPNENNPTRFSPWTPVSFKQLPSCYCIMITRLALKKKNKTDEYIY